MTNDFNKEKLKKEIDDRIEDWRKSDSEHKIGAINALQNLRVTYYGEMYPCEKCGKTKPHFHDAEELQ